MLPDLEWRCQVCRKCLYWWGNWEAPRIILEDFQGVRLSICTKKNCRKKIEGMKTTFGTPYYSFVGITTVKGLKQYRPIFDGDKIAYQPVISNN